MQFVWNSLFHICPKVSYFHKMFSRLATRKRSLAISTVSVALLTLMGFVFWPSQSDHIDFNTQIRPILNNNCLSCHGGVKKNGGFSMLFREEAMQPAKSGEYAIVPFHPEKSELIKRIVHHDPEERMPVEADPLPEADIQLLTKWIEQGAEWDTHWAYIPVDSSITAPDIHSDWIRSDLDRFVLRKLSDNDLSPSEEADPATLFRRVSFDLTGLPPTQEEAERFLSDPSPDAYEKAVDRLLTSPHFGERWAAMWMDLARYGDSQGYQKDPARNIWRWRDWVIHAFNEDMPFDQFTIEQLAGDLLPEPSDQQLLATAFHRNTMSNDEGGTDDEEFRVTAVIDRVNTTFEIWQGTTMGCVQCHSHPYDPILHDEFYELYAFFNNTADADRPDEFPTKLLHSPAQESDIEQITEWIANHESEVSIPTSLILEEKRQQLLDTSPLTLAATCDPCSNAKVRMGDGLHFVRRISSGAVLRYPRINLSGIDSISFQYLGGNSTGYAEIRLNGQNGKKIGEVHFPPAKGWYGQAALDWEEAITSISPTSGKQDVYLVFKNEKKGAICDLFGFYLEGSSQKELKDSYVRLALNGPGKTPIMQDLEGESRRVSRVFERGNWLVHGDTVEPSTPDILNPYLSSYSPDRLGLAQWLVAPDNPLTARVIVNRFWEQVFGVGLVETLEDFGTQGEAPSHPEMLDWMAYTFQHEQDWSVKQLLRSIVLSATYRQSSAVSHELQELDPANRLLSRGPRVRLTAEQIRDQALAISGLLDTKLHGPSVMPPQPDGVWQVIRNVMRWIPSDGGDRHRRTLYTYWRRSSPYPSMMTFDAPSREFCVSRRVRTNTPLQALATLNDTTYVEAAQALAQRMEIEGGDSPEDQVTYGYRLAMLKEPTPDKAETLFQFHSQMMDHYQQHPAELDSLLGSSNDVSTNFASLMNVASVILNLDETITKE